MLLGLQVAQVVEAGSLGYAIKVEQPSLTAGNFVRDAIIAAAVALMVWAFPLVTPAPALSKRQRQVVLGATVFVTLSTILWMVDAQTYQRLGVEDGVIEWVQTLLILGTSVSLQLAAIRWKRSGQTLLFVLAQLGAVAFFVFGGEEISWGQRIFGFESTGVFATVNEQAETNLHNFLSIESDVFLASGSLFLFGILPLLWFRAGLVERLEGPRLTQLRPFFPAPWLALLMMLSSSLGQPFWDVIPVQALTWALVMLAGTLWWRGGADIDRPLVLTAIVVTIAAEVAALAFGVWPDELLHITEYRETVVAVGFFAYGRGVLQRANEQEPATN